MLGRSHSGLLAATALSVFAAMPPGLGQRLSLDPRVNQVGERLRPPPPRPTREQRLELSEAAAIAVFDAAARRVRRNARNLRVAAAGGFGAHPFI
jgi:hypothetical protein